MKKSLSRCPKCGRRLFIREYECHRCGTKIIGEFEMFCVFEGLEQEYLEILRAFISTYGNIGEVAKILGVSRPTAKARIQQLGEALGIKMQSYEFESNLAILEAIEKGEISIDEALEKIRKGG